MRITLTNHARMRAMQRGIHFEEIVQCVTDSDSFVVEGDNKVCYKKLGEQYVLLVYTVHDDGDVVVITTWKTSQIDKYFP